jgi:hypothetical protein
MKLFPRLRILLAAAVGAALGSCDGDTLVGPSLEATCSASPATGVVPLLVAFSLGVSGAEGPFTVAVSYGDGASGSEPDRPHTFVAPGVYTASFTVSTATQSARCASTVTATSPPVVPVPLDDTPPKAVFDTIPAAGPGDQIAGKAPLAIRFNMCGSSDVDLEVLRWTMDFEGDGRNDVDGTNGSACRRTFTYAAGTWHPRICVTDLHADGSNAHPFQCKTYTVTATP